MPAKRTMSAAAEQMHTRIPVVPGARDMDEEEALRQS